MESSPNSDHTNNNDDNSPEVCSHATNLKTPVQQKLLTPYDDYSPVHFPCTQDAYDPLDVVWDWNSPTSKKSKEYNVKQKRLNESCIPKKLIKRHHSGNQPDVDDEIKNKLQALKNLIDTEQKISKVANEFNPNDLDDLFNDSIEDELILQSQKVEENINLGLKESVCDISINYTSNINKTSAVKTPDFRKVKSENNLKSSYVNNNLNTASNTLISKSTSASYTNKKIDSTSYRDEERNKEFKESFDDSFELALISCAEVIESNKHNQMDLIEKRRLEALAKLRSKQQKVLFKAGSSINSASKDIKRHEFGLKISNIDKAENSQFIVEGSPPKCSPEEIEKKRLEALAKLKAKKDKEIMERNRMEALKRLEMNKKKSINPFQKFKKI